MIMLRNIILSVSSVSESDSHAAEERYRLPHCQRAWIDQIVGQWLAYAVRIAVGAVGRVAAIEQVVDLAEDLDVLGDLIGAAQIDQQIGRQPRVLVGVVAD